MKISLNDAVFKIREKNGKNEKQETKEVYEKTNEKDLIVANTLKSLLNNQGNEFLVKIIRIEYVQHAYENTPRPVYTIFNIILPAFKYGTSHTQEFSFSVRWNRLGRCLISSSESTSLKWAPLVYNLKNNDNIQKIADVLLTAIIEVQEMIYGLADEAAYVEKNKIKLLKECYSVNKKPHTKNSGETLYREHGGGGGTFDR